MLDAYFLLYTLVIINQLNPVNFCINFLWCIYFPA